MEFPILVGGLGVAWRVLVICFVLFMQGMCAVMYLHYPECDAYVGHGTAFVCMWLFMMWYIVVNGNLFYNFHRIRAWKMHLFRLLWMLLCQISLLVSAAFALTPVLCHYLRYWVIQHHELFVFTFFDEYTRLDSWDFNLKHRWWVMIISAFMAWIPFAVSIGLLYFIPNEVKKTRSMIPYMQYRQTSQMKYEELWRNPKSDETQWLFLPALLIGLLFIGVMVFGATEKYDRQKWYYEMRMEQKGK